MKRLLIILVFILALGKCVSAAPDSTQVAVVVAGHVTSSVTGIGIPAHLVYILGDTFSTISIYDSAFTNPLGYYADTFLIPASAIYSFKVYTYDCQGIEHDSLVGGPNNYFEVDFDVCDSEPPSCVAAFSYAADPLNPSHIIFADNSSGNISQWYWDFGDGSFSTQQNTSHTYVSSGTYAVMLYVFDSAVVPPCYSVISQIVTVNVYPMFNLGGQVFGGLFPLAEAYVVLYKQGSPAYLALDTALLNTDGVYYFYQIPAGNYVAKAFPAENPSGGQRYFPTYSQSSLLWQSAGPIYLGQNIFNADVSLYPVPSGMSGSGAVSGEIFQSTATTPLPFAHAEILLFDSLMQPLDYVLSASDGTYAFNQLAEGLYYLQPEVPGKLNPAVSFTIGNGFPMAAVLDLTVPGDVIGLPEGDYEIPASRVFPNPAFAECAIRLEPRHSLGVILQLRDITGRVMSEEQQQLPAGPQTLTIPLSGLATGLYLLVIQGDDGRSVVRKIQIIGQKNP